MLASNLELISLHSRTPSTKFQFQWGAIDRASDDLKKWQLHTTLNGNLNTYVAITMVFVVENAGELREAYFYTDSRINVGISKGDLYSF
ncbi:MAG TPA: hypothetical protein VFC65_17225 [Prolixibacteraceae bacterium]|nr:hypothetical protein [Prolixibacteraceae bacterium]